MKRQPLQPKAFAFFLASFFLLSISLKGQFFEDYLPDYPDSGMLNVRDFGAKGDGISDDLPAIKKALEIALGNNGRYSRPPFIYFPAGTYLISDTLESRVSDSWSRGWRAGMMLMGESRSSVTIKIADNHPLFQDPEKPKPIIITGSEDPRGNGGGNRAFRHNIVNLTVDTGVGNPGAVGIDYVSSNRGVIRNVTVRSGDPEGLGVAGIAMNREWPGPALVKNVSIEGFDSGIQTLRHGQYSMTLSRIGLKGQRKVGIENDQNGLFIDYLFSQNNVPVLRQNRANGLVVVINGLFKGQGSSQPAIINQGEMVLRNITIEGYPQSLESTGRNKTTLTGNIDEWISDTSLANGHTRTVGLPSKESPEFVSREPGDWANAAPKSSSSGAQDVTSKIQRALDSGKPVVYLPNGSYQIDKTLIVPPTVRKITGLQSSIGASDSFQGTHLLKVVGAGEPLVIEHLWFSRGNDKKNPSSQNKVVVQDSSREVVFRHCDIHGGYENTPNGTGTVFFEDTMGTPIRMKYPQEIYGRQVNCEFLNDEPMVQVNGGSLWLLGYKTEGQQVIIDAKGGTVEVLGGLAYALGREGQNYTRDPMIRLSGTKAGISILGNGNDWTTVIVDDNQTLLSKDAPRRGRAPKVILYRN
ncbi:MAG: glycosyl hydrolase family 28-related protein [Puniceicoccaceae bacterium]